jgi:hypothetical protein
MKTSGHKNFCSGRSLFNHKCKEGIENKMNEYSFQMYLIISKTHSFEYIYKASIHLKAV